MSVTILTGDALTVLRGIPDASVQCCVTSPPYFGLRDYKMPGQIGLEATPAEFVAALVAVFTEVRRILRDDGTLWLNLGDSYAGSWGAQSRGGAPSDKSTLSSVQVAAAPKTTRTGSLDKTPGLKAKDLIGIPWRVAFALQTAGWYLRSDIIWHKPNPMPEPVTDRPTKAHEYIFLLTKSERYYYDAAAIHEPVSGNSRARGNHQDRDPSHLIARKSKQNVSWGLVDTRNKRSVWSVPSAPYSDAHFATYPPDLIRPCILAGCPAGGTVLDPFGGSGTTGEVAEQEGRHSILIELNPEYVELAMRRTAQFGLLHTAPAANNATSNVRTATGYTKPCASPPTPKYEN